MTIVEFSDFQCPFCAKVQATLNQLLQKYPNQVRLVYRDFPLTDVHPLSATAATAARCAGEQGAFWKYHDLLYSKASASQSLTGTEQLVDYAKELGLSTDLFQSCLTSGRYLEPIQKDWSDGKGYGVTSTPTFFVNGHMLVGAAPLEEFERLIEKSLAEATRGSKQ